jgi:uncharacterized integral membrane protein (TIGR00698 family)
MFTISPQWALLTGILVSLFIKASNPLHLKAKHLSSKLLQVSVILLGSALNFNHVIKQGAEGVLLTLFSISIIFFIGFLGIKFLRLDKVQGVLITMGTAICGGSAIAALSPVLAADSLAVAISIGTVFLLNAFSVFIFPSIGEYLSLTQDQFGLWSALAIHDTSAVVASASIYGERALQVASTVKLTRALWIIPITLIFSIAHSKKDKKIPIPWFIFGFLALSLAFTFIEQLMTYKDIFLYLSKQGFAITLFLIGLTFNLDKVKQVGAKPFIFGTGLWIIVSLGSLYYIYNFQLS